MAKGKTADRGSNARMRKAKSRAATRPTAGATAPATPRFEVFAIRIAGDPERAAAETSKLTHGLPGRWQVRPVAPHLHEFELVPMDGQRVDVGAAWNMARILAGRRDVEFVEPLFAYAGLEPDPSQLNAYLAPHEMPHSAQRLALGGGGDDHKPCASADSEWSLKKVRAQDAWVLPILPGGAAKGQGIVIGHPDTGYTLHPEIWGANGAQLLIGNGFDFVDDDPNATDPLTGKYPGHGTATASVIMSPLPVAAYRTVTGTAPEASLVPLRVSTSVIHLSFSRLIRAIYHAVDAAGVHVISMSLGGPFPSQALERALTHAIDRGVVPLAAAGNVWPFVVYPARYSDVIAVAATNCLDQKWAGSASGGAVDISAPGESVWRASAELARSQPKFKVGMSSGTSYAVATTAGVCALWLARHGRVALIDRYGQGGIAKAFRQVLKRAGHVVPTGWDANRMGVGIIDAHKALSAILPATTAGLTTRAPKGVLEQALDYFPEADPDRVASDLMTRIPAGRGRRAALVQRAFETGGDELLFHLGTNPALRARIHQDAAGKGGAATAARLVAPPQVDASDLCSKLFAL